MPGATLLAIDPDLRVLESIRHVASRSDYRFLAASGGAAGLRLVRSGRPDAIVSRLGLELEGMGALAALLRREAGPGVPILLTRTSEDEEMEDALDLGGVSFLTFPFTEAELSARIGGLLRWARRPGNEGVLNVGPIAVDLERGELLRPQVQPLTGSEFAILRQLLSSPRRALASGGEERAVDVHVAALRSKLGPAGRCIETLRGIGYRLTL